ncbi:MAG: hypothetical protein ACMG5Z_08320 [Luteimonas sp.]
MEFHIRMPASLPELGVIDDAIRSLDPAALVDIDETGELVRVATSLRPGELVSLINAIGYPVADEQVTQLPSVCCGGCSG